VSVTGFPVCNPTPVQLIGFKRVCCCLTESLQLSQWSQQL